MKALCLFVLSMIMMGCASVKFERATWDNPKPKLTVVSLQKGCSFSFRKMSTSYLCEFK